MERRTFGRAGVTGASDPGGQAGFGNAPPVYHTAPETEPLGHASFEADRDVSNTSYGLGFMALPLVLALIEAMFAGTAIITPINSTVLWSMRIIGLFYGAVFWWFVTQSENYVNTNLFKATLMWLAAPVVMLVAFGGIAWRVADLWEFGLSSAPFETASYQIDSIRHGRKGARDTIHIDPFKTGESLDIPVSDEQYQALRETTDDQCVTVYQRRSASGAIQVLSNGRYTMSTPEPMDIKSC